MRKFIIGLIISASLMIPTYAWTQTAIDRATTTNFSLVKPATVTGTWGEDINDNFDTIDSNIPSSGFTGDIKWKSGTSFVGELVHGITAARTWTMPDSTGTLAIGGSNPGGDTELQMNDDKNVFWGTGSDASIDYDGTDMKLDPAVQGTGELIILSETVINADGQTLATPDGTLHVFTASAGSVTADTRSDNLVVEGGGDTGISILSDTGLSLINFGDTEDNNIGELRYSHSDNQMHMISNNETQLRLNDGARVHVGPPSGGGDTDLEVSNGSTVGAGTVHCTSGCTATHSSKEIKTDVRYLNDEHEQAYIDVKALKPIEFRYKVIDVDPITGKAKMTIAFNEDGSLAFDGEGGRIFIPVLKANPTGKLLRGYAYEDVPSSIKENPHGLLTSGVVHDGNRAYNLEMAVQWLMQRVEALEVLAGVSPAPYVSD